MEKGTRNAGTSRAYHGYRDARGDAHYKRAFPMKFYHSPFPKARARAYMGQITVEQFYGHDGYEANKHQSVVRRNGETRRGTRSERDCGAGNRHQPIRRKGGKKGDIVHRKRHYGSFGVNKLWERLIK